MLSEMKSFTFILFLLFAIGTNAQDYQISFAGAGASSTLSNIQVENLTQGKSISLLGSEVLHLVATSTGLNPIFDFESALRIYPNPTNGICTIDFSSASSGIANIELFDVTGKRVGSAQNILTNGIHSYQISNLQSGIYSVKISSKSYNYTEKLVSNGSATSKVKINYLGNGIIPSTSLKLKSVSSEKIMQYNTGDRLKFTGITGNYSTIVTDIPNQNKTITFSFVDCTDADKNNYPTVKIGNQLWMAENLKTANYSTAEMILNRGNDTDWSNMASGGYCFYNNSYENKATYGTLYN